MATTRHASSRCRVPLYRESKLSMSSTTQSFSATLPYTMEDGRWRPWKPAWRSSSRRGKGAISRCDIRSAYRFNGEHEGHAKVDTGLAQRWEKASLATRRIHPSQGPKPGGHAADPAPLA